MCRSSNNSNSKGGMGRGIEMLEEMGAIKRTNDIKGTNDKPGTTAPEQNVTSRKSKRRIVVGKNKKSGSKIKTPGGTSISSASMDLNIPN